MQEVKGRHELKHYINTVDVLQLRAKLHCIAKQDENVQNGNSYLVKSLYFDNYEDKILKEKLNGIDNREKFRIRLYNNEFAFIRLEKKSKKRGICFKESAVISKEECQKIINGEYEFLKEGKNQLLLEFYGKLYYQQLRPKNIVVYQREAYVYPPGNVRVTLDSDIRSSFDVRGFLRNDTIGMKVSNATILEVKYDEFLPEIIRKMVALTNRKSTAFSKYAAARII